MTKHPLRAAAIGLSDPPQGSYFSEPPEKSGTSQRYMKAILQRFFAHLPRRAIRGGSVAVDNLLSALVQEQIAESLYICVPPNIQHETELWVRSHHNLASEALIRSLPSLNWQQLSVPPLEVWFELSNLNALSSLRVREWFTKQDYPLIITNHTLSLHNLLTDYVFQLLLHQTFPWDSLVCSSAASATALASMIDNISTRSEKRLNWSAKYHGRIDTIPLPVDTEYYCPGSQQLARRRLKLPEHGFLVLYLGYISHTKADMTPFLRGLREISTKHLERHVTLVLAGVYDEPYQKWLQSEINHTGMQDTVVFRTDVSPSEKRLLYHAADIFFSPSDTLQESFGLSVVEAMASGLPQVVSDWDGYRELVADGETGYLIPTWWGRCDEELTYSGWFSGSEHDHVALGQSVAINLHNWNEAITSLVSNPPRLHEMSLKSRERAVSHYSNKVIAARYQKLAVDLVEMRRAHNPVFTTKRNVPFYTPEYYSTFAHYATFHLEPTAFLITTGDTAELKEFLLRYTLLDRWGDLYDTELLTAIQMDVSVGPITVSNILKVQAGKHPNSSHRTIRHIMWLVKHGFVEITC